VQKQRGQFEPNFIDPRGSPPRFSTIETGGSRHPLFYRAFRTSLLGGGGRGAGVEPSPRAPWYPDGPGRTWFVSGGSGRPGSPLGPMDQAQVPRSGRILAGHTDAASAPNLSLRRAAGTPSHQALRCGPPARTPFASGPRPFELAANPADPPSTGWHSRPHLSAAPVPQGVCRKGRIGPKSNF
jgi:hypothetical protein